jgi:hypothetical protein
MLLSCFVRLTQCDVFLCTLRQELNFCDACALFVPCAMLATALLMCCMAVVAPGS